MQRNLFKDVVGQDNRGSIAQSWNNKRALPRSQPNDSDAGNHATIMEFGGREETVQTDIAQEERCVVDLG